MKNTNPSARVTVPAIRARKHSQDSSAEVITALTAYDYTFARLLDGAGIDIILVGDSVAAVVQGHVSTLPVTLDEIIYHSRCVARGVSRALVVGDLPFMSYQISEEKALESAGRLIKEGGVAAVKLEGGVQFSPTIARLVSVDIPVMGHVGLTPQSYHRMGGHKVQGTRSAAHSAGEAGSRERVIEDALAVEQAGAFAVVVEGVPQDLGAEITARLSIPVIGIGAGPVCDGQILVTQDMLGMQEDFKPKFVKRYAELARVITGAVSEYIDEVRAGTFPSSANSFGPQAEPGENQDKKLRLV